MRSSRLLAALGLLLALACACAVQPIAAAASVDDAAAAAVASPSALTRLTSSLGSSSSNDDGYPAGGSAAIGMLIGFSLLAALLALLYSGTCCARLAPTPGAGLFMGQVPDASLTRQHRLIALALTVIGFALHLASLGLDDWSEQELVRGHALHFGLVKYRIDSGANSATYAQLCEAFPVGSNNEAMCQTLRAAGAVTLAAGILATLGCVLLMYRLLRDQLKANFTPSSAQLIRTWRLMGLTWVFGELCALAWISGYVVLLELISSGSSSSVTMLAPSCYIALATPMCAAIAQYFARQAVLRCPVDPATQSQFAVVGAAPMAYQPLVAGQPAMPAGAVYMQPQGQPVVAYYQQPPQQQQQLYPVMQSQQPQPMPAAYAPPQPRY